MSYPKDLRNHLELLENNSRLFRINRPTVLQTELASLVRLQYRGLPEEDRHGFLFENVVDIRGRKYDTQVATGIYASSLQIYALGLGCEPTSKAVQEKWTQAQLHPVEPELVSTGPAQDSICDGEKLLEDGQGLELMPVPVEVPGYSGQIRTSTQFISKDPETGIRNMGNYSGHIFGKKKLLWEIYGINHGMIHWKAWKKRGKAMPAAIVIGGPPSLFYVAASRLPYGVDELSVAGGFGGEAIDLVKCKTVDIEVPAQAEFIIEGLVSTEYMEPGNAFGEYTGYLATDILPRPIFEVTAVTSRRNPIYVHIVSQFPPSESSKVGQIASENILFKFLSHDCKLPGVLDVAWHEMSQRQWCVIKVKKINNAQPWQILNCAAGYESRWGKFYIVVDADIDPRSMDSVIWALSWRVQPARDIRTITGKIPGLDLSAFRPDDTKEEKEFPGGVGSSGLLIDATTKYPYPPTSLPQKQFMEKALDIWKELKLPELNLIEPWYGYPLGYWPKECADDAELVLKGEHYKVGDRLAKQRKKV